MQDQTTAEGKLKNLIFSLQNKIDPGTVTEILKGLTLALEEAKGSPKEETLGAQIEKAHESKVYARLLKICLECYESDITALPFHTWMETRGLGFENGFYIPIETRTGILLEGL